MKVYNKKLRNSGMFFLSLAVVNTILGILNQDPWYDYWLCLALALYGLKDLHIAQNEELSKNHSTEQNDERNQALDSLSRDKAFTLLRWFMFALGLLFLILGATKESDLLLQVGFTHFCVYTLTFFLELICYMHYNDKI